VRAQLSQAQTKLEEESKAADEWREALEEAIEEWRTALENP